MNRNLMRNALKLHFTGHGVCGEDEETKIQYGEGFGSSTLGRAALEVMTVAFGTFR